MKLQLILISTIIILSTFGVNVLASHEIMQIFVETGEEVPSVGETITIKVFGAQQIVLIEIITEDGTIIDTLSFVASNQGEINLPYIIPGNLSSGTYTVRATDTLESVETTFEYITELDPLVDITISTDKREYSKLEVIEISGNVSEIIEERNLILNIIHSDETIKSIRTLLDNDTGHFYTAFHAIDIFDNNEEPYTVVVEYGNNKDNTVSTIFLIIQDILDVPDIPNVPDIPDVPNNLQIHSDKPQYYRDDIVTISGTMTDVNWNDNLTIHYEVYHDDELYVSDNMRDIVPDDQGDGEFSFEIDESFLRYDGRIKVIIYIQNSQAEISFNQYLTPDMTNETLYRMIMDIYNMINTKTPTIGVQLASHTEDISKNLVVTSDYTNEEIDSELDNINNEINFTNSELKFINGELTGAFNLINDLHRNLNIALDEIKELKQALLIN